MACKNCTPESYALRLSIAGWLASGHNPNQVAAILTCALSIVEDVQANGVGEAPAPLEYETFNTEENSIVTTIKKSKSTPSVQTEESSSIDE